jgi:hypothetical protein
MPSFRYPHREGVFGWIYPWRESRYEGAPGPDARHYRICYLNNPNPETHAEPVLRSGEELKALECFRRLNSTADAARSG